MQSPAIIWVKPSHTSITSAHGIVLEPSVTYRIFPVISFLFLALTGTAICGVAAATAFPIIDFEDVSVPVGVSRKSRSISSGGFFRSKLFAT